MYGIPVRNCPFRKTVLKEDNVTEEIFGDCTREACMAYESGRCSLCTRPSIDMQASNTVGGLNGYR